MCQGLFPCAPMYPTLAVDLKLLEFARIQFLSLTPNVSGWCEAVVTFLKGLSFNLQGKVFYPATCRKLRSDCFLAYQDPIRRRFSNAMRWYQELLQASQQATATLLERARISVLSAENLPELDIDCPRFPPSSPSTSSSPPIPSSPASAPSSPVSSANGSLPSDDLPHVVTPTSSSPPSPTPNVPHEDHPNEPAGPRHRPSEYLRRRCILCFGAKPCHDPTAMYVYAVHFPLPIVLTHCT